MLCLSRKENQRIVITTAAGERIELVVSQVRPDKVKLGFDAPQSIRIDRAEVDQKRRDNPRPPPPARAA